MKRFYVSATWDNWPEGGSYATVVVANDRAEAELLCMQEMACLRTEGAEAGTEAADPEYWIEKYSDHWHIVDCCELDTFIKNHYFTR